MRHLQRPYKDPLKVLKNLQWLIRHYAAGSQEIFLMQHFEPLILLLSFYLGEMYSPVYNRRGVSNSKGGLTKFQKRYKRGVLIEEGGPTHFTENQQISQVFKT